MSNPNLKIKEAIKAKGLTVEAVAKQIGVLPSAISQSINGNPTVERLQQIADVLEIPVYRLFDTGENTSLSCPKCGARLKLVEE